MADLGNPLGANYQKTAGTGEAVIFKQETSPIAEANKLIKEGAAKQRAAAKAAADIDKVNINALNIDTGTTAREMVGTLASLTDRVGEQIINEHTKAAVSKNRDEANRIASKADLLFGNIKSIGQSLIPTSNKIEAHDAVIMKKPEEYNVDEFKKDVAAYYAKPTGVKRQQAIDALPPPLKDDEDAIHLMGVSMNEFPFSKKYEKFVDLPKLVNDLVPKLQPDAAKGEQMGFMNPDGTITNLGVSRLSLDELKNFYQTNILFKSVNRRSLIKEYNDRFGTDLPLDSQIPVDPKNPVYKYGEDLVVNYAYEKYKNTLSSGAYGFKTGGGGKYEPIELIVDPNESEYNVALGAAQKTKIKSRNAFWFTNDASVNMKLSASPSIAYDLGTGDVLQRPDVSKFQAAGMREMNVSSDPAKPKYKQFVILYNPEITTVESIIGDSKELASKLPRQSTYAIPIGEPSSDFKTDRTIEQATNTLMDQHNIVITDVNGNRYKTYADFLSNKPIGKGSNGNTKEGSGSTPKPPKGNTTPEGSKPR